jgi:hypothetical protein
LNSSRGRRFEMKARFVYVVRLLKVEGSRGYARQVLVQGFDAQDAAQNAAWLYPGFEVIEVVR